MEFDSGIRMGEDLDSDGDLAICHVHDAIYLNITELNYIINNAPKMIEDFNQSKFEALEVNPDLCSGCPELKETNEEEGIEYTCRAGLYTECGRM